LMDLIFPSGRKIWTGLGVWAGSGVRFESAAGPSERITSRTANHFSRNRSHLHLQLHNHCYTTAHDMASTADSQNPMPMTKHQRQRRRQNEQAARRQSDSNVRSSDYEATGSTLVTSDCIVHVILIPTTQTHHSYLRHHSSLPPPLRNIAD
jgi:hypothetical protein